MLGFLVSERGIEIDPAKIKAISEMPPPRTEKEIRGFLGRVQYINRFIAHLTAICEPIFKLLRKDQPKTWNPQCQLAFDRIKEYLTNPPVLVPPTPGRPLLLYLSILEESMGSMIAQHDEDGRTERAVYYLSKKFTGYEVNYTSLEKTCTALVWVTRRLRHYMLSYPIVLISRMDPIKYLFEKPALTGRMARWLLLLSEFDITYMNQKSIKGSVIAEHLSSLPIEANLKQLEDVFPDEEISTIQEELGDDTWVMFFDGAANHRGYGAGVLLVDPDGVFIPLSFRLEFECTNNIAEYEACVRGLRVALSFGVQKLKVYGDSSVVIYQVREDWKTRDEKLVPYKHWAQVLASKFKEIDFGYFPRDTNRYADALATLASMIGDNPNEKMQPLIIERMIQPAYMDEEVNALTIDSRPWFASIVDFIRESKYPADATSGEKKTLRRRAAQFILCEDILYKRSYDGVQLVCVDEEQARNVIEQIHEGICGPHMNARMLAKKILRLGYYWDTMEADCVDFVKR